MASDTDDDSQSNTGPLEYVSHQFTTMKRTEVTFGKLDLREISLLLFQETAFSMLLGGWALLAEFFLIKSSIFDNYPGSAWLLMVPTMAWIIVWIVKLIEKYWLQGRDSPAQRTQRIVLCLMLLIVQLLVGNVGIQDRNAVTNFQLKSHGWLITFKEDWKMLITLARMFVGSCATMTLYRMFVDLVIKACLLEGFPMVNDDYDEDKAEMKRRNITSNRMNPDNNDNVGSSSSALFANTDINQHFAGSNNHVNYT